MTASEASAIFSALADGKVIQCRRKASEMWLEIEQSTHVVASHIYQGHQIRVKPEPRVRWRLMTSNCGYATEEAARKALLGVNNKYWSVYRCEEVIE